MSCVNQNICSAPAAHTRGVDTRDGDGEHMDACRRALCPGTFSPVVSTTSTSLETMMCSSWWMISAQRQKKMGAHESENELFAGGADRSNRGCCSRALRSPALKRPVRPALIGAAATLGVSSTRVY